MTDYIDNIFLRAVLGGGGGGGWGEIQIQEITSSPSLSSIVSIIYQCQELSIQGQIKDKPR